MNNSCCFDHCQVIIQANRRRNFILGCHCSFPDTFATENLKEKLIKLKSADELERLSECTGSVDKASSQLSIKHKMMKKSISSKDLHFKTPVTQKRNTNWCFPKHLCLISTGYIYKKWVHLAREFYEGAVSQNTEQTWIWQGLTPGKVVLQHSLCFVNS